MKSEFAVMFLKHLKSFVSHRFSQKLLCEGKASPRQRATSNKVTLKESQPTLSLGHMAELQILRVYHKTSKAAVDGVRKTGCFQSHGK